MDAQLNAGGAKETNGKAEPPLCVDLDGTLLKSDMLHEALRALLMRRPWLIFNCLLWLFKGGKAYFKRQVAARVKIDPVLLPYHGGLLRFLKEEYARGRRLVLASASDIQLVEPVAEYLGIFEEVYGSDGLTNLSGERKLEFLETRYGKRGFDYAGNHPLDLLIWAKARRAIVVSHSRRLIDRVQKIADEVMVCRPTAQKPLAVLLSAVRVHQWIKNVLLFVPLVMAHRVLEVELLWKVAAGFLSFSLCAAGIYLINDLADLEADRLHQSKKYRPLASGDLSQLTAVFMIPLLLVLSLLIALYLARPFAGTLGVYLAATLLYSLYFKKHIIADIVLLALLYALRILAGGYAVGVVVSQWLLAFSLFFFLSLACVKRFSELRVLRLNNQTGSEGRGYLSSDLEGISQFGTASGYISILVLALYISSREVSVLYRHPETIWLLCPVLLYWISRIWLLANRGLILDDPILFAIKDKLSYLMGLISVFILFLAL